MCSSDLKGGGEGSQEVKLSAIGRLLSELDARSAKYAVKMVLGKLRTGFSDMTVLDALSWMIGGDKKLRPEIENMYNVKADLGEIAEEIVKHKKPRKLEPEIGTPVLMARCERAKDAAEIWERNGKCALEYKLDGLRIQAHVAKKGVALFSRGLENVTAMYPDVTEGLAEQIKRECIVEGEMIALDKHGKFLPFQETAQRKRKYQIAEMVGKVPLTIFLFDVLVADRTNMTNRTYEERRRKLEELVERGGAVRLVAEKKGEKGKKQKKSFFTKISAVFFAF